jgi:hypothetical protein
LGAVVIITVRGRRGCSGVRECFEDEVSVTGELLAVGGQRDHSVRLARQRGAVGVLATANVI